MLVVQSLLLTMLVFDLINDCFRNPVPLPADPISYIEADSLVEESLVLASLRLVPYP
jgi:hypothetical protein